MNKNKTNMVAQHHMHPFLKLLPGIILAGFLTAISIYLGEQVWFVDIGLGALTLAILLGIFVGNTVYTDRQLNQVLVDAYNTVYH